ncbi:MAG: ATP-binding protein, partial [Bifidobacterium sp.]|nr:ATP-binding protein [Bifidobacterium sp.]
AAARTARYAALRAAARKTGAAAVLLAHTLDDQAETVLIDLIRAAGTDAMAGMPASQTVDGTLFLRPLLDVARAETTAICGQLGLDYWDDPTNGDGVPAGEPLDVSYPLRSRVRHDLLPALSAFAGRDMARRLADGARVARRDVELLDRLADGACERAVTFDGDTARIDARRLADEDEAIRFRVVARVLARCAPGSGSRHVEAVEALVSRWHGQGPVTLPSKHVGFRWKHVIEVCEDVTHANRRRARQD